MIKNQVKPNKYVIFGSGFIAEHFARHLIARDESVTILYHSKKNPDLPFRMQTKAPVHMSGLEKIFRSLTPDYVILTQGLSFIPDNEKELNRSVSSNVISPLLVMESLYRLSKEPHFRVPKKILTFGSAAEYGANEKIRWTEDDRYTRPTSLYGLVKNWLGQASKFYADLGLPCVHLRHFNAIGAGQNPRFVVSSFCRQTAQIENKSGKKDILVGDTSQKRDFIDIRDAVRAYDLVIKRSKPGQIVNICTGITHPVSDILDILKKESKTTLNVKIDESFIVPPRTRNKTLSGKPLLLNKMGWKPKYSLEDSIVWTLNYWRSEIKNEKKKK